MTRQEIFDQAVIGLKAQDFIQSIDPIGQQCLYRAPSGRKCAIGHLITDEEYHPRMEGHGVRTTPIPLPERLQVDLEFLSALQNAHDGSSSPDEMQKRLRRVANDFNLEWNF